MSKNIIELNGLTKFYGEHRGIEDVSFTVEEGDIYGFIGPNGAGKTTTIRTILALIHPTSGSATIFGKDCIKEADQIAREVGYLPSEAFYYENMKVKELLKYAADLYQEDCDRRIVELSERLKLDVNRKITDLSFGNKKKVGIVAALLHSPKLVILDEPTSGLDPLIQQRFFEILREENQKGMTILFSSHVLSEVQKFCHKVAILKEGRVIDVQKISELRKYGYKKIELRAKKSIPEGYFKGDSIANYQKNGNEATFIFKGDVAEVVEKLYRLEVNDLFIEEPSLDEIFLHYYH